MRWWALLGVVSIVVTPAFAGPAQPRELGEVAWERDFSRAEARAHETGRPVFALFQEVPGCQTCVSFGEQVLSHPLLVEAIESEFVPVAVYNNRGGDDRQILKRFGELPFNNPVVRFLDREGLDLLPRRAGVWFPHAIGRRMVAALEAADRPVPAYLQDVVDELSPRSRERATFAMHCFWSGEVCLGEIDGILASRAGWLEGSEVVELTFDPSVVSYEELLRAARTRSCSDGVFTRSDVQLRTARAIFGEDARLVQATAETARASDQKRALQGTPYARLGLTPRQALRVNAAVAAGRSPAFLLSPRQRARVIGSQ